MVIQINMIQTVAIGVLVFLLGDFLVKRVAIFRRYCIPAPVIGGLILAIINLIGVQTGAFSFKFDNTFKDFFMIAFFSTIGFSASIKVIKQGGVAILILFIVSVIMLIVQNIWGVAISKAFGINPLYGLAAGSISLMGGVGSSAAYGPILEANGADGALAVAIASATFGLVMGGLVSGPIAKFLIDRKGLLQKAKAKDEMAISKDIDFSALEVEDDDPDMIKTSELNKAFFMIVIAMGVGTVFTMLIKLTGLVIPAYIGAIFAAAIIRNIADSRKAELPQAEIAALGNIFLSVFLAMTIMSLEIWKIAGMALPLITILVGQVILLAIFDIFIVYNAAGKDYDSAVMTAGFYGYAMGATPNAMASMSAVVDKYGRPSPKAYFTIPIVGGFIIDLTMSLLVIGHMNLILAGIL
ncbi:MAG: sodium--glutamate symport carrier GltS [Bacillota bacterium]|jgi:ESS family glutamate:Na+ symporter|nr:sodium--glutamate symport carrier GltS [Bacillota bacterium]